MALPILVIICWNAYFCFLIGITLNALLFYLARKYSSVELKDYRCLLYIFCALNSTILALHVLAQPLFLIGDDGTSYIFLAGILSNIVPIHLRLALFTVCLYCTVLSVVGLALQFLDRYLLICRNVSSKSYRFTLIGILTFFLATLSVAMALSTVPAREHGVMEILSDFDVNLFLTPDQLVPKIVMEINVKRPSTWNIFLLNISFLLLCYLVVVVCYCRIRAFIKENMIEKAGNHSKRDFIRQISLNMLLQATLPLYSITIYAICVFLILSRHYSLRLVQFEMLSFVHTNWLPMLNPLVTILTIRKYRAGLVTIMGMQKKVATTMEM